MASETKPYVYEETAQHKPQVPSGITGKPLKYEHDPWTNMMIGDSGGLGGFTGAGANTLPFRYTDDSLVRIPIKVSDIYGPEGKGQQQGGKDELTPPQQHKKKGGFFRKLSNAATHQKDEREVKIVPMSRGDYLKYWAKGEDGKFLPDVVEPPEGRAAFVEDMLDRFKDRM